MRIMHRLPLVLLLLFLSTSGLAATQLEIIELQHRPADEVLPLVRPFLNPQGSMTATGFKLLVRSTPSNIEELRQAVREFDVGVQRLRITVQQDLREDRRDSETGVRGRVLLGDGDVRIGERGRDGASVVLRDEQRSEEAPITHSVQVAEGEWAAIATGDSIPVRRRDYGGGYTQEYVEVSSGFEVRPRVKGAVVHLEIRPRRSRVRGPGIEVQRLDTTVTGRLGEWLDLGGVMSEEESRRSGTLSGSRSEARSERSLRVRVERID